MYEEELPVTGAAIGLFGVTFGVWWIVAVGIALVLIGVIVLRLTRSGPAGPSTLPALPAGRHRRD